METTSEPHPAGLLRRPAPREGGVTKRARFRIRAALAPLALATYTLVAAAGAALALAPALLARGPLGRRRTPRSPGPELGPARLDVLDEPRRAVTAAAAEEREALGG